LTNNETYVFRQLWNNPICLLNSFISQPMTRAKYKMHNYLTA